MFLPRHSPSSPLRPDQSEFSTLTTASTLVEQSKSVPVCWQDLILLDIVMPVVSGFEVLRFIRSSKELTHLPVIVFSGNQHPDNEQESLRLGANAFRLKPHGFQEAVLMAGDSINF